MQDTSKKVALNRKLFLSMALSLVLGASVVPLPGLAQVILESLNPITVTYGTLIILVLALCVLFLPVAWCQHIGVYNLVNHWVRKFAVLASCLASIFVGLAIGYSYLYDHWLNSILRSTSILSGLLAIVFFAFAALLFLLQTSFFADFVNSDDQQRSEIRLSAFVGLCGTVIYLYVSLR